MVVLMRHEEVQDLSYPWPWTDAEGRERLPTAEENPTWYDLDGRLRGSLRPMEGRCGRQLARTNPPRYCMGKPNKGSTACRLHGGKSLGGVASPTFRNGKYSKYMPKHLKKIEREVNVDPELLSLRDDLVVQTSWIAHKLNEFNRTPPPSYEALLTLFRHWRKAKKPEEKEALSEQLEQVLQQGRSVAAYHASLEESIRTLIQERTKTAQAEWKRLHDLNALVPFEQVAVLLDSLLLLIREVVGDERKLAQIHEGMRRLMPLEQPVITLSQEKEGEEG